jgi:hypothetical protein
MTSQDLQELTLTVSQRWPSVEVQPADRLYWNQYPIRVVIYNNEPHFRYGQWANSLVNNAAKTRQEGRRFSLFFHDAQQCLDTLNSLKLSRTQTCISVDVWSGQPSAVRVPRVWEAGWRYRVTLRATYSLDCDDDIRRLMALADQNPNDFYFSPLIKKRFQRGFVSCHSVYFYVRDQQMITLLYLTMAKQLISRVQQVVP